ncbi:MAG: 50S ribosomal protein L32e [Desulfurococcaceae archaeon]
MSTQVDKYFEWYLKLREEMKRRRPEFLRHLWWKKPKFKNEPKWRKPKGIDNKMRLQLKGYPPIVKVGYRGPRIVRGLHPQGAMPVVVNSVSDLSKYDPAKQIIYIGRSVGIKKALEIYKVATERGFRVANPLKPLVKGA